MLHRRILEKELLDKQLQLARDVQVSLFPAGSPHLAGYDIAGICLPAEAIGGDYYDFIKLPRGGLGIAVVDVSGNGIAPALVMVAFRGLLRMHTHGWLGPAKIVRTINRLLPDFTGNSQYFTAVYGTLNEISDEFTFVCCGHPPPFVLHPHGGSQQPGTHGPALGLLKNITFPTEVIKLTPGDIMALYTDGVVEIVNCDGVEFGVEGLKQAIFMGCELSAEAVIQEVVHQIRVYSGALSTVDDFTRVIVKRL